MEAKTKRNIKSGDQYDHLFPVANLKDEIVKKGASVSDTVRFIPKVVMETLEQTNDISQLLKGDSVPETCRNIWHFVYDHINYQKDDEGLEQIRSPARTWNDRHRGVDCDCYTVFISSILTNLKIPHRLRIARYKQDHFQHIYPVVPRANGKHITIDCVVEHYNYEEPYTEIKDTPMDLQYLSGTDDSEELGKKGKGKVKQFLKKAVHVANRANPATVLLRNGVLAAMKLNLMKVAQRLKYAYLSDAEAQKRDIDMGKFQRLKQIKDKLEKIFFGAGGKPENLRKAILTGKGNKNHDVQGLGDMNVHTPLNQLLGNDIYYSENELQVLPEGEDLGGAFGALGEPVTAASVTAATGVIATIAGLLKGIGNIFKKKNKESGDFETSDKDTDPKNISSEIEQSKNEIEKIDSSESGSDSSSKSGDENSRKADDASGEDSNKDGFWDKNKKWLKPTMWGAGGLSLLALGYHFLKGDKKEGPPAKALSGTKGKSKKKEEVTLM